MVPDHREGPSCGVNDLWDVPAAGGGGMRKMWLGEDAITVEVPYSDAERIIRYGGIPVEDTGWSDILTISNPSYQTVRDIIRALPWDKVE